MAMLDLLIALLTILGSIWTIIHIYMNYKKMKPLKDVDNQVNWLFAGGKL